jgi:hypothetical protein
VLCVLGGGDVSGDLHGNSEGAHGQSDLRREHSHDLDLEGVEGLPVVAGRNQNGDDLSDTSLANKALDQNAGEV